MKLRFKLTSESESDDVNGIEKGGEVKIALTDDDKSHH